MRGFCWSGPKFLAVFASLNARRLSVRPKAPGSIYQFACEVFLSENQSSWRYFPVLMRGVSRSEPKYLAMFSSLNARRFSVGIKIPGDIYQFGCEVVVGQNQNPRQYLPIWMRGVGRSDPNFLAGVPSLNAWCLSVRTKTPGNSYQFKCVVSSRPEPKVLAILPSWNARLHSVRTEIPGDIYQFEREAFFCQIRNSWRRAPAKMRGVSRSELKFLANYQFKCEVLVGQNQNSWRSLSA